MRMYRSIIVAGLLLAPLHAMAQTGSVGGSGSGAAGVTTGTAPSTTNAPSTTGAPNVKMPGPPGVNAAGTAQSSGSMTTGSASGNSDVDAKIREEDPKIDKKIKSICKGC